MQAKLCRFAHRPYEQQDARHFQRRQCLSKKTDLAVTHHRRIGKNIVELDGSENLIDRQDAQRKTEIANPVDNKCLHCCGMRAFFLVPETDQQVGRHPDPFPAKEQLHQIIRCNQHQHRKGKQAQIGHKARAGIVMRHIADRIDMHH